VSIKRLYPGDNNQHGPYPHPLLDCLGELSDPRPEWKITLEHLDRGQGSEGLTLVIELYTRNSYRREHIDKCPALDTVFDPNNRICHWECRCWITVHHLFPLPPAAYNKQSWRRWLLDQMRLVNDHETSEFFSTTCPHCEGKGKYMGKFTKRSGEIGTEWTCPHCKGRGFIMPFAPNHAEGYDPYRIVEYESDLARTTPFNQRVEDQQP